MAFNNSKQTKKVYAQVGIDQIFNLAEPYKQKLVTISLLILLISLLSIISAKSYQVIIDDFLVNDENSTITLFKLISLNKVSFFVFLICLFVIKNTLSFFTTLLLNDTDARLQKSLRFDFIKKIFSLSIPFLSVRKSGDSLTRLDDLENIGVFFSNILTKFLSDMIMIFVGGVALISLDIQLFLIVLGIVFLYSVISISIVPKFYKKQRELMEHQAQVTSKFSESINSIELIKTLQLENKFEANLFKASDKFIDAKKIFGILEGTFTYLTTNIQEIGMLFILWVGINRIHDGVLTLGQLIAFQSLMGLFVTPMINLFSLPKEFQQFMVSFERVFEYQKANSETYNYEENKLGNFELNLNNLSFKYGNRMIFKSITLNIKEGEKIFLYGLNGSGKSTLFKNLDKINRNYEGAFMIDNREIRDLSVNTIRDIVEYTPSSSSVFSGTVFENIIGKNEFNESSLEILGQIISNNILNKLFNHLNLGLDSMIYEKGANLSEGQKQLISFCRTLVSNKKIMIFDEDTSHIDQETEEKLLDFAFNHFKEQTFIFTSHSGNVRKKCDKEFNINSNKITLLEKGNSYETIR